MTWFVECFLNVSTHSRAEAAAGGNFVEWQSLKVFQHTAARRRLPRGKGVRSADMACFNTQPRGGGCQSERLEGAVYLGFNTQPRGGGCRYGLRQNQYRQSFNTQPRGGGCARKN